MTAADRRPFSDSVYDARASLPPTCQEGFGRLVKLVRSRPGKFQLLLMDCRDERLRDRLIRGLDDFLNVEGRRTSILRLSAGRHAGFADVEYDLMRLADTSDIIHVQGGPSWFERGRWDEFNIRREAIAHRTKVSLVFWLDSESIRSLADVAIDLWAWRGAVITFSDVVRPVPAVNATVENGTEASTAQEAENDAIEALYEDLRDVRLPEDLRLAVHWELGEALINTGRNAEAGSIFRELMHLTVDERLRAGAAGRLADVLESSGELHEALHTRREEQLPIYERLGDIRTRAITMGRIADILEKRGELDEVLRIRRDEELPVYERIGDVRARAVTMGQIASVLQMHGELDEALRIHRDEGLPVYERLGDVRSYALTMGKVADLLQARGELSEALRIRREEELPVYERLGDGRAYAITMGRIADVLQARGDLDEALRIRREEELPVYERLGDVRERTVTMGKVADVLQARGELDEVLRIRREEELPIYDRLGDVRSRAVTMGRIADVLEIRGELDEVLRIRREDELPFYEGLGDVRSRILTMNQIANVLETRGDVDEALRMRRDANAIAAGLGTA